MEKKNNTLEPNAAIEKTVDISVEEVATPVISEQKKSRFAPQRTTSPAGAPFFVKKPETLESKLRAFKRSSSGIIADFKKHQEYKPPSVADKEKSKKAQERARKNSKRRNSWS